jgi:DNA-binding CsgD family transcriptional regulator
VTVHLTVDGRIDVEPPERLPRTIGAAVEVLLRSRGDAREVGRVLQRSSVPMVMVDNERRYVKVNRPARLAFRLSQAELRKHAVDDFTPPDRLPMLEAIWARLVDAGSVAGRYPVAGQDGDRFDVVYYAVANVLPGLHVGAFAPADWPEDELATLDVDEGDHPAPALTPRELQVLQLAAEGLSGPSIAASLVVSPGTVKTHFEHVYEKLGVRDRAAAVARALRLGLID